jgi:hypothetical protein
MALVDAIMVRGVLTGDEVDAIIEQAVAIRAAEIEAQRRRDWRERQASAARLVTVKP